MGIDMYRMVIGLFLVLNLWACDSIPIIIVEVSGKERIRWNRHLEKWVYKLKAPATIEIRRDTCCQTMTNPDWVATQGTMVWWCEPDSCRIVKSFFFADSIYSVYREE